MYAAEVTVICTVHCKNDSIFLRIPTDNIRMLKGNLFLLGHLSFGLNISVDRVARKPVLIQSTFSVPNDIYRIIVTFGKYSLDTEPDCSRRIV